LLGLKGGGRPKCWLVLLGGNICCNALWLRDGLVCFGDFGDGSEVAVCVVRGVWVFHQDTFKMDTATSLSLAKDRIAELNTSLLQANDQAKDQIAELNTSLSQANDQVAELKQLLDEDDDDGHEFQHQLQGLAMIGIFFGVFGFVLAVVALVYVSRVHGSNMKLQACLRPEVSSMIRLHVPMRL
jgi:hypothetical protein